MQKESPVVSVVDDDPSVRKALARLMRAAGYQTCAYESAEQFLSGGGVDRSECLILDVHLPGMNGLELQADLVRKRQEFPIVFISAFSEAKAQNQAIQSGAVDFLPKPLDIERLLAVVREALTRRQKSSRPLERP